MNINEQANFIWSIADLLRGDFKQSEYGKVILPFTVLRRFDCVLAPSKAKILEANKTLTVSNKRPIFKRMTGHDYYNVSQFDFEKLMDDSNAIEANLRDYINGFSEDVREIMDNFEIFGVIDRLSRANLLYLVVQRFAEIDMSDTQIDNLEMGYMFEELIRRFSEQSNETAGEHFTPREVIELMVEVLLDPDMDEIANTDGKVITILDPACGTGGMLSVAQNKMESLNSTTQVIPFGQELNPETYATCRSDSLPNATYIGFTGTPISSKDRSTREVFGDYIDIYDMTQAVEDGATRPVYYESRVVHLKLDESTLRLIDQEYDIMAQNADPYVIEKSKKELGQMEAILGAEQTINSLVNDIIDHYENYRAGILTGKAMIVAYSRPIAMKIYKKILELRPGWTEKVGVVMTQGNNDPEEWREIIGNKAHKDELARKFKDNSSPMKIAIVVDMWLTGFDVPSLATMYVYKPMAGHNLMQAIARVNRVFKDKEGGLVVDYVGIAAALKQAMNDYTVRDKKNYGNTDVSKAAYPKFLEKLSICRDMLYGFDYSMFITGTDLEKAKTITGAVNFVLGKSVSEYELPDAEKTQSIFIKEALLLRQALTLCASLVTEEIRFECAFFEAVRTMIVRLTTGGTGKKFTLPEVNERINELLKHSIQSEGVINLFSDVKTEFSLFDPKFLEEVSKMKERNLAVELLKKLIAEQVSIYRRTNLVKSDKFSEIIQSAMNRYLNGMLTNEQVIEELLKLAKDIAAAAAEGDKLGLTQEEMAFYDALTKPQAIKDFYENDELIAITKELTDLLRKNRTIDWQKKESARAGMRRLVKRLLKKHKYPPEGMDDAVQTVMSQCEMWTDNVMTA